MCMATLEGDWRWRGMVIHTIHVYAPMLIKSQILHTRHTRHS